MAIVGDNVIRGTVSNFTNSSYFAHSIVMPEDGSITNIVAYVNTLGATADMAVSLFSVDGGGAILNLLASGTATGVVNGTPAWVSVNFSSPYNALSGVTYFICFWVNDSHQVYYDAGSTGTIVRQDGGTYPTWQDPNTHGAGYNVGTEYLSVYANYTPTAGNATIAPGTIKGVQSIKGLQSITF